MRRYLRGYKFEPLCGVLVDRLHLSALIIGLIFAFLYFGVLIILHAIAGHQLPANLQELFSHPEGSYYYPNLIGVAYDLIGHPLFFVFLAIYRIYIPKQFLKLEQEGLIREIPASSYLNRFFRFIGTNRRIQIAIFFVFPSLVSVGLTILRLRVYQPATAHDWYSILLSLIGTYAIIVVFVQIAYIFIILNNFSSTPKMNFAHPDNCGGLAPYGNLATAVYSFLFLSAMFQAVGTGGGAVETTAVTIIGSSAYLYLWVLYPLSVLYVFERLIYKPHKDLYELQRQYLEPSSLGWTSFYQRIRESLRKIIDSPENSISKNLDQKFNKDIELLETWTQLDKHITDVHNWPISKASIRLIAIFVNPLLPILLPFIISFIKSIIG